MDFSQINVPSTLLFLTKLWVGEIIFVLSQNSYRLVYVTHFCAGATDAMEPRDVDAFIGSRIAVYLMTLTQLW